MLRKLPKSLRVILLVIFVVTVFFLSVLFVDAVVIPRLEPAWQQRWIYAALSTAAILAILDSIAGFTGYTIRDWVNNTDSERIDDGQPVPNTITGPVQVVYGDVSHTTVNVTYIVQREISYTSTTDLQQTANSYRKDIVNLAPSPPVKFVGRRREVETFKQILLHQPGSIGLINQIQGMGGIGKTALVSIVAHDPSIQQVFADGILWASVGTAPDLRTILYNWIKALDPDSDITISEDSLKLLEIFRSLAKDRKLLVIFDDAYNEISPQIRTITNVLGKYCKVVITSRSVMFEGAQTLISLDVLPERESIALLQRTSDRKFTHQELTKAKELVFQLGYHPLTIRLAGAYLQKSPSPLEEYVAKLRKIAQESKSQNLDAIRDTQKESLGKTLDNVFQQLSHTDQKRMQMLKSLSSEGVYTSSELVALWQINNEEGEATLRNLTGIGLLELFDGGYRIHPLVLSYVKQKTDDESS